VAEETPEREDRRVKYRAVVDYELAMTQARFQTLAIFLAAVGFVVGSGHFSRPLGAVLLFITLGLWIVDLRSRDVLSGWRSVGQELEGGMLAGEGGVFLGRNLPTEELMLGLFATKRPVRGRMAGVLVHQVGVDVIFSAIIGFAVALLAGQSGWAGAGIIGGVVALLAALATLWGWLKGKRPKAQT
jgi:hypothetical protein